MKYKKYGKIRIMLMSSLFIIDYYFINIFKQMYVITKLALFSFEFQFELTDIIQLVHVNQYLLL